MWRPEDFVKRSTPAGTTLDDAQLLLGFREGRHSVDAELRSDRRRASDEYQADVQPEEMRDSRDTLREMRLQQLAEMEVCQMGGREKGRSVSSGEISVPSHAHEPFSGCNDAGKQHSQRSSLLSSVSSITGSVRGEIQDIKQKIADIQRERDQLARMLYVRREDNFPQPAGGGLQPQSQQKSVPDAGFGRNVSAQSVSYARNEAKIKHGGFMTSTKCDVQHTNRAADGSDRFVHRHIASESRYKPVQQLQQPTGQSDSF